MTKWTQSTRLTWCSWSVDEMRCPLRKVCASVLDEGWRVTTPASLDSELIKGSSGNSIVHCQWIGGGLGSRPVLIVHVANTEVTNTVAAHTLVVSTLFYFVNYPQ